MDQFTLFIHFLFGAVSSHIKVRKKRIHKCLHVSNVHANVKINFCDIDLMCKGWCTYYICRENPILFQCSWDMDYVLLAGLMQSTLENTRKRFLYRNKCSRVSTHAHMWGAFFSWVKENTCRQLYHIGIVKKIKWIPPLYLGSPVER